MRRDGSYLPPLAATAALIALLHAAPAPADSGPVRIRRIGPQQAAARGAAVAPAPDSPLAARALAHVAERAARWRSFPDLLSHPRVDWSPQASRRAGWRRTGPARERTMSVDAGRPEGIGFDEPETLRVAILRIDFAGDRGGTLSSGSGRFDLSNPGPAPPPVDRPPHNRRFYRAHLEALSRYYEAQTYGGVIVTGDVWPRSENGAYTCTDMADFEPQPDGWSYSQDIYPPAVAMFRAMLFAADTQSVALGDRIPWQDYDRFILLHAGSDLQSDVRQDSRLDIPSFTIGVIDSDAVIFRDSLDWNRERPIDRAALIPETINQDDYYGAINGVLTHECGHLFFGFSDLYDVETGLPRVGLWSLMDSGNLVGSIVVLPDDTELFATGLLPPSVDPFQRSLMSFNVPPRLQFLELPFGQPVELRSSQRHPDARVTGLSSDEFLILENRYQAPFPQDSVPEVLEQDDSTRVVLGPKWPDRYEYDALLPAGGILVWHVDLSVIPNEYFFPCDSGRANPGCGLNTNPARLAVELIEADGLDDLGDLNSPYLLGAPRDPWWRSNNPALSDTTRPSLRPHIGTRPHLRIDFLDEADSTMRVVAYRTWQLPGWPVLADLPAGGPELLAVDADGDGRAEVFWAGGGEESGDPLAIYGLRANGDGVHGPSLLFSSALDRAPLGPMAALPRAAAGLGARPVFAVTTRTGGAGPEDGRVWLIDADGEALPGWPAALPALATTPPVLVAAGADTFVYVGCDDGRVRALGLDGSVRAVSEPALGGPIRGRLAVHPERLATGGASFFAVAAGAETGDVAAFRHDDGALTASPGWPRPVGGAGFAPDFLWLDFGPSSAAAAPSLVAHHADVLWAFGLDGEPMAGWGRDVGDTLVAGLGAGDPDGDGVPEVLTQSVTSQVTFWNAAGYPSPGWPRYGSLERFRTGAAPLAVDLDGNGATEVIAMNASGIVGGFDVQGRQASGWPLATGLGAGGTPALADLDGDGLLEMIAPDGRGALYAYSLPTPASRLARAAWPMAGGDPGRTSALPAARATQPAPDRAGPLVSGSLKAYPNPARRRPVALAYSLTEPAEVEFRVLDASGSEVASFVRSGRQTDNVEVWDPGSLPAGLYVVRLRFRGRTSEASASVPVGVLR